MVAPVGFAWTARKNGDIAIEHHGTVVTVVRGDTATRLRSRLDAADEPTVQHLLARATGNYRRGNERQRR